MKKSLKIYLWTVAATVFFTLGLIMAVRMELLALHHRRARNPTLYTLSDNNLDRGASRWDNFWSEAMFACPLTDEQKQKLDRLCKRDSLHWTKETEPRLCYEYFDEACGERGASIQSIAEYTKTRCSANIWWTSTKEWLRKP